MTGLSACAEMVQQADPVRFRGALLANGAGREALFVLYAFNLEIAKIAPMVSEAMLGEIRLQWWRESLDMAYGDGPARRHEVAEPLTALIREARLPRAPFDALIDARGLDLDPDFPTDDAALRGYLRDTSGGLTALAAAALAGADATEQVASAGYGIGVSRYLSAVPAMVMGGDRALPGQGIDWKALRDGGGDPAFETAVTALAADGLREIDTVYSQRAAMPASLGPAFAELADARAHLRVLAQGCATLADIPAAARSDFRSNLGRLMQSLTGRW